jgi:intracellular sulfur oxidation DsrE/DsrF family protein
MNTKRLSIMVISLALVLALSSFSAASGTKYEALQGVNSINAIIDWRHGTPKSAAFQMNLLRSSYNDLKKLGKNPYYVLVFMGPAVKLISSDVSSFKPEDHEHIKEFKAAIARMKADGIKFEVCVAALKVFKVDSATVISEVDQVPNGWIAEMGYQARGYSLVPIF